MKYNIPGFGTISRWVKWYEQEQKELLSSQFMPESSEKQDNSENNKTALEKELELAKVKIATLETLIDIAEEQFKIEIRKKPGIKPSIE